MGPTVRRTMVARPPVFLLRKENTISVADLDAGRFCRGYNTPLAMMGVAPRRCLPGAQCHGGKRSPMYSLFYLWFDILRQSVLYQIFNLILGHQLPIIDLAIVHHHAVICFSFVKIRYIMYADVKIILIRKCRFLCFKRKCRSVTQIFRPSCTFLLKPKRFQCGCKMVKKGFLSFLFKSENLVF